MIGDDVAVGIEIVDGVVDYAVDYAVDCVVAKANAADVMAMASLGYTVMGNFVSKGA